MGRDREVLVIDSYVDKWRWIRPDGKENWDAERRFSTLRLLQADWERKRQDGASIVELSASPPYD